jgi:hypothetical protein
VTSTDERACDRRGASGGPTGDRGGPTGDRGGPTGKHGHEPPLYLVCAIAEAWAEESLTQFAQGGCEDPLSGLATLPYLRTRLAEVYREAEQGGTSPADTHRLLVVGLPRRPDPWRRMALAILVGHDLRAAFPGGETLSIANPGPPSRWSVRAVTCHCVTRGYAGASRSRSAPRSA